eukprot:gnl/TRDRNA2_/TRDRNA2_153891_c0_seq3.p1 gnl/TRDRNA2_/TRDRNA2_153891_c0~~gnl/TRDRNA2_/TRDRNA2_153891_c0_seq3.p1  ORF type:complete len:342 (+),score=55.98 gnl/TRDRNA2_/TRDRNA2_153891_c0_seq3:69-1094(+)
MSLSIETVPISDMKTSGLFNVESLVVIAAATLIWYAELTRRCGGIGISDLWRPNPRKMLRLCAPEVAGLAVCFMLGAWLIKRSKDQNLVQPAATMDELTEEAWTEIREQWPMLTCADSLLAVQAMVRFLLTASAALRPTTGAALFSGEPAAFFLFAGMVRSAILTLGDGTHRLDGPLGGRVNIAFEAASLLPLLWLSRAAFRRSPIKLVAVTSVAARVALNNWIILAPGAIANTAFSFSHLLEVCASVAFLLRYLAEVGERQVSIVAGFVHVLLPLQQALSVYYFLYCFLEATDGAILPELVGAGMPFELLQIGGMLQLGMYLLAAVLHFAMPDEESEVHL